jgi:hypothetical protein
LRSAYMRRVIAVQAPRPAIRKSNGAGPASVPPKADRFVGQQPVLASDHRLLVSSLTKCATSLGLRAGEG